jgi:hypothetical protein
MIQREAVLPMNIELILPQHETRGWHLLLLSRIRAVGHAVGVKTVTASRTPYLLEGLLRFEQRILLRRSSPMLVRKAIASDGLDAPPDLRIDLSGTAQLGEVPVLAIKDGRREPLVEAAMALARGDLPSVQLTLDGTPVGTAHPMVDNRFVLTRGLEDVLARTISLLMKGIVVSQTSLPRSGKPPTSLPISQASAASPAFLIPYATHMIPRLAKEAYRRGTSRTHAHWCVGYRFLDGPGVAETHDLSGPTWTRIADDSHRFFADPFPLEHQGRFYIFLEEYEHAKGKGVISVSEVMPDGRAAPPRQILEEDYHLSYPNVFRSGDDIWMLPEGGASKSLVLYRATDFPFGWERHETLIADRELADPTLVERDGRLWLFAAERDGAGSAADMMSVFFANDLHGPWTPHPANPIVIDRAGARPGGNIVLSGQRLLLPLQDGTETYGGGLQLVEIVCLTEELVEFGPAVPVRPEGNWPFPKIHTLNRAGRLEVIDGIVP